MEEQAPPIRVQGRQEKQGEGIGMERDPWRIHGDIRDFALQGLGRKRRTRKEPNKQRAMVDGAGDGAGASVAEGKNTKGGEVARAQFCLILRLDYRGRAI